jgi:hypothetical protein
LFRTNPIQAAFRILTAIAIHGVYDLMVIQPGFPAIAAVLIAIFALINAIITIKGGWASEGNEPSPVLNWSGESAPIEQQQSSEPTQKSKSDTATVRDLPVETQPGAKSEESQLEPQSR